MRRLPQGTVTFLFTDIEGSTRLLAEHGERYAELLAEHRRVLREAFAEHGGVEVDTQGDAFFVAFARASEALAAAEAVEAAEAVCDADLDTIESLVVKSLVRRRFETGRLLMLETIREYAWERFRETPEAEEIHRRHAEFFLEVARAANLNAGDLRPGGRRFDVAFAEQDNFRELATPAFDNEVAAARSLELDEAVEYAPAQT